MEPWLVVLILGDFFFILGLAWIASNFISKRQQLRSEERLKILGRFSSSEELTAFLESETGRRLLDALSHRPDPRRAIAKTVQLAIVLAFLGFGFLTLFFFLSGSEGEVYVIPGTLVTMASIGALIGAGVSSWMSKKKA